MTLDAELVRLAAEKVMGWRDGGRSWRIEGHLSVKVFAKSAWNPLTSDTDAMMLVDRLVVQGWDALVQMRSGRNYWNVEFWKGGPENWKTAHDPNRRRAIVLACLRAVGVTVE